MDMQNQVGRPVQLQVQLTRSVARVEGEDIVVEIFKDATGKTIRQQGFTLEQLQQTKLQVERQYQDGVTRLNEMLGILEVKE